MTRQKKDHLTDNKGFTLIELLVVLAIVAIITAMAGITLSVVNNANVTKSATTFNSLLSRARSESIARGTEAGTLVITCENGKVYGQIGSFDKELICTDSITVYVGDIDGYGGGNPYEVTTGYINSSCQLTNGSSVTIQFTPSGVIKKNDSGVNSCKLLFVRNSKRVQVIYYRQTGKHELAAF